VQRYRCKIGRRRTFSLLPDSLLPYHSLGVANILKWLYAMLVKHIGASTLSDTESRPRKTLSDLKNKFLRVVKVLRLPGRRSGAVLDPPKFLQSLAQMLDAEVAGLFGSWKELEPKHSILGIYAR
jgi:hypothetical protein